MGNEAEIESGKRGNVKIDIPPNLNDPKFVRSDLEFMTDEYKRALGK